MSSVPDFIESTGETVEDAIRNGLDTLGVSPAQVMIDVLEEPGGGMFGTEKRPARVRLQLIGGRALNTPPAPPMSAPPTDIIELPSAREARETDGAEPRTERAPRPERERSDRQERSDRPRVERPARPERSEKRDRPERDARPSRDRSDRPARPDRFVGENKPFFDLDVDDKDENLPLVSVQDEVPESEQDEEAQVSKVVLNELLERMSVRASISVRRAAPDETGTKSPWVLDVNGGRLSGKLVGRRGETLAALQYITRLISSRELQRRVDVVVDVDSYKVKRAATLHSLALRFAEEAVNEQRTITLEPMPPHERRIIHLALRGREDVSTRSVGEGQTRKVTIVPQSQGS